MSSGDESTPNHDYDVLVIGGGAAGENAGDIAARGGLKVGLIEHDLVGGECTYWACMPSKALLRPGEALEAAARVPGAKEAIRGELDVEAVFNRRDSLAANWDDSGQVEWLEGAGVDLIRGHGQITGEREVTVTSSDGSRKGYVASRAVVVATGSSASFPPIDGLEESDVWDSRDVTTANDVPRRLLIIGGGAVGSEMAQAWKWLGSEEVTVVELFDHLLSREEKFAGDELQAAFERMGMTVHTSAETNALRTNADGSKTAEVGLSDGSFVEIDADEILVATGRKPNTTDLGLENIGIDPGEYIDVDDHLRATGVTSGWLYAVGDVNGRSLLTHTGKYQARVAGAHITGLDTSAWGDKKAMPRVVFTSPEVAAVGLTETQAEESGIEVRTVEYQIGSVAAASTLGRGHRGTCKLVVDSEKEIVVGATFVGPRAGEMIHAATVAIAAEVPLETLWHVIPSFPTLSEVWLRLLEQYRDKYDRAFS
ncbi:MAG: NAD(P)/FAD-dependent oxidoreductase [Acidimicrobiia bacterium]